MSNKDTKLYAFSIFLNSFIKFGIKIHRSKWKLKLDLTRLKTQAILDVINYNILNSTALYDYNIRSYEQQRQC
jgi:hypothetical protein